MGCASSKQRTFSIEFVEIFYDPEHVHTIITNHSHHKLKIAVHRLHEKAQKTEIFFTQETWTLTLSKGSFVDITVGDGQTYTCEVEAGRTYTI